MSDPTCERHDEELCELAIGTLTGRERGELLAHVEHCERCAGVLDRLSLVADTLLSLAPQADPPLGFEVRVLERMQIEAPKPSRVRGRVLSAIAAVALVLAGVGGGIALSSSGSGRSTTTALASFDISGMSGEAVASAGNPGQLLVAVRGAGMTGDVRCWIVTSTGQRIDTGSFWLDDGAGWWKVRITVSPKQLKSAVLVPVDHPSQVLAQASFSV